MQKIIKILIVLFLIVSIVAWLFPAEERIQNSENRMQRDLNLSLVSGTGEAEDKINEIEDTASFFDKLGNCEASTDEFEHPFTGDLMDREVIGLQGDKCSYREEMPGGAEMNCLYSEDMRIAMAKYYKDIEASEMSGVSIEAGLDTDEVGILYFINGKEVSNPFEEAISSGECVIEGY